MPQCGVKLLENSTIPQSVVETMSHVHDFLGLNLVLVHNSGILDRAGTNDGRGSGWRAQGWETL
jgi:hypothetical protein